MLLMAYGCSRGEVRPASSVYGERALRMNSSQLDRAALLCREKEGGFDLGEMPRVLVGMNAGLMTPTVLRWFLVNATSQQAG